MRRRYRALIPVLAVALIAAARPTAETRSLSLSWKDPGTFFALQWGDNAIKSGEEHCHSYPEQWVGQCRLNAQVLDALELRLSMGEKDWGSLERAARQAAQKIHRCLNGRKLDDAPGCYGEGDSNTVSREFRDQYGGRWTVYAALGYPSEGRFNEPLWANAVLQRLGPMKVRLDARGRLLAVSPPAARSDIEARRVRESMEHGLKSIEE